MESTCGMTSSKGRKGIPGFPEPEVVDHTLSQPNGQVVPRLSSSSQENRDEENNGAPSEAELSQHVETVVAGDLPEGLSYTISDQTFTTFTEFIKALRGILADHLEPEDICDPHQDTNMSPSQKYPLLAKLRAGQPPARWIDIKLQVVKENETWSTTLVMREDNVDVMGFMNQKGVWYELGNWRMLTPQYSSVLLGRVIDKEQLANLLGTNLGEAFVIKAVWALSLCTDASDVDEIMRSLVGLRVMVCDSARMNHVLNTITNRWDTGTLFTKELMNDYVCRYGDMSKALRQWKGRNYEEPRPTSELSAIYLVLNEGYNKRDLLSFAYPEMLKVNFPEMFKDMSMATVKVYLRRVNGGHMNSVHGEIAALISDEHRQSVCFRVGSMLLTQRDELTCSNALVFEVPLDRSKVVVPSGWVLQIKVDLHIKIPNEEIPKHLNATLCLDKKTLSQIRCPKGTGIQVQVTTTWRPVQEGSNCRGSHAVQEIGEQSHLQLSSPVQEIGEQSHLQLSSPVQVMSGRHERPTVVYTIGDDAMSFIEFIKALRRILADHPGREDILDGHKLLNIHCTGQHPLLAMYCSRQPERWLHVKLQLEEEGKVSSSITLVMRGDNLYVHGFFNHDGVLYKLIENNDSKSYILNPNSTPLYWGVSYPKLLKVGKDKNHEDKCPEIARKLTNLKLHSEFAVNAVRVLSSYMPNQVTDIDPSLALAGLIVMVCESARMNPIHDIIAAGWTNGSTFTMEMVRDYLWQWAEMSGILRGWRTKGYDYVASPIPQLQAIYLVFHARGSGTASKSSEASSRGPPALPGGGGVVPGPGEAGDNGSSGVAGSSQGSPSQQGGEGPSQGPRKQGEKADDVQGRGRPLVELLAIRANLGVVGTTITVFDGKRGQIIYRKKEQGEQEKMVELLLTGPYTSISAYGCFAIEIDIPGDPSGPIEWEWDCEKPEYAIQVDPLEPASHWIRHPKGHKLAEVTYAVMSNARKASVQVGLRLKDGHSSSGVNGEITALIDGFKDKKSTLFRRAKGTTGQCFSPADDDSWVLLQLARKVVAVPCGKALHIDVDLQIENSNNQVVKDLKVPLNFDNGICGSRCYEADGNEVQVSITWYPEITRPEQTTEEICQPVSSLAAEDKIMFGNLVEVVHTIGDEVSFTRFITDLRRVLAEHPDREDIFELRPLLAKQHAEQPARWLHIKLQVVEGREMSTTLLMRDDNLYVCGFINRNGILCRLVDNEDSESFLPGGFHTSTVQLGVSYHSLLQAKNRDDVVRKLTAAQLGSGFAMDAVRVLSRHPNKVSGIDMSTGVALAGLIFIVCESARMISVHESIESGWRSGKGFTEKLMYDSVWKYVEMSSKLQAWKIGNYAEPHPISELQATSLVLNTMLPDVDAKGHGRPRVELLAIRADLRVVGTKITVFDGKRGQIIYRHEKQGAEQGRMVDLELTGPYTCISASGCFAIKIDIPNSPPIKWEWDCYDRTYANQVDGPPVTHMICTPDDSRKQVAEVTYAVMSNAREATVQVKLRLKDGHWSGVVNGEITALIDGFKDRSVLFSGAKGTTGQCLSSTEDGSWFPLQLSRKVVAVPCGSALHIEVNLLVATDDGDQVKVKVPLRFDNGICSSKTDDSKSVEVEVTWYPEIPPQSHPPEQITSKEADVVEKFITARSEQSEPPEVKTVPSEHVTVVYTIGDELSFTEFIVSLRRILADHPDREDVLDEHPKSSSLFSTTGEHPVLPKQRAEQPARWIHIKLQAKKGEEMMSTTLLMRDDNLYVCGFINQQGELFELIDNHNRSTDILPVNEYKARRLSWGVSYRSLLDADTEDDLVRILSLENMGCDFMMQAMYVLSRFPAWVDDHMDPRSYGKQMNPRMALAGLIVMVCESARMNPIQNIVTASWWSEDRPYNMRMRMWNLTRNYVSSYYGWTSRELLTWKSKGYINPHPMSGLQDIYLALNYRLEPPPQAGGAESSRRTQGTTPQRRRWMAGDAKDHGRPRVEVLAMRADIGVVGTTVMVFDGKRGHIIYKDEQGKQGMADLVLTRPCKSISAYGCFAIKIDIPPGAAVGSSRKGDAGGSIKWEWDCYDQEYRKEVDKPPVTRTISRNVEVTYAVMSEAFEATVQVKMMRLRDGNSTGIVYGSITARIGDLKDDYKEPLEEKDYYKEEIILFKRTEEMGQHFSPTDSRVLQLSRSVIAVPHWLLIKMALQIETSDNQQRVKPQPVNTTLHFRSGILSRRRHEVDGNEVEVTVTWHPDVSTVLSSSRRRWDVSTEERRARIKSDMSYMVGDSGEGFSAFITELRRLIADHPGRKDVLEEHPDPVLSSTRNHPVLPASGYREETIRRRWLLHIKLHAGLGVETPSITLAMHADTLDIVGFMNQKGHWYSIYRGLPEEYKAQYLAWGRTYQRMLGVGSWKEIIDILNSKVLGKTFIADAVSSLSHYGSTEVKAGGDNPKLALVGLMVMVCESAKFNSVHEEIVRSWEDGTELTEQLMGYIKNWREMSTALLDWKDHIYQGWPRNEELENIEIKTPHDALDKVHLVYNNPAKRFATRR